MTADDFRATLDRQSLTQNACARALDVDERTVRRWASGAADVPRSVALVFALLERLGLKLADL